MRTASYRLRSSGTLWLVRRVWYTDVSTDKIAALIAEVERLRGALILARDALGTMSGNQQIRDAYREVREALGEDPKREARVWNLKYSMSGVKDDE